MPENINNLLEPIKVPILSDSGYGENINSQFDNINKNFNTLANREFIQGPDGQGVNVIEINFEDLNLNVKSTYITISEDLKKSIELAFKNYDTTNPNWYAGVACAAYLDSNNKLHSLYPIIYSKTIEDITEDINKTEFQSLQFDYNNDDVLCLKLYDQNFPGIEYNKEVNDWCWVLNGKLTDIVAKGPQGDKGQDAKSFDVLIVDQKPIENTDGLHEIKQIYYNGTLRDLTPTNISTYDDLIWYAKLRPAWINANKNNIFITSGPKPDDNSEIINFSGKMIQYTKASLSTQSDVSSKAAQLYLTGSSIETSAGSSIISGIQNGQIVDIGEVNKAIEKIAMSGLENTEVKFIEDNKSSIIESLAAVDKYIYCMKLSTSTIFNMTMTSQTTAGTLFAELESTYPGTTKGSTQALFLRDWDNSQNTRSNEAYSLHNSGNKLVIGRAKNYEKIKREVSTESYNPDHSLITINNEGLITVTGKTNLGDGLTVTGETKLEDKLTVGNQNNPKSTILNGELTVTGKTKLGEDITITSDDFENYFGCKKCKMVEGRYHDSLVNEYQIKIINIPYYIQYILNKDINSIHHYIGKNFNFYIRKFKDDLYKINGNIEFNLELGQFILDCFFQKNNDQVIIPYNYNTSYRDSNGNIAYQIIKSIDGEDIYFYGLKPVSTVGGVNLNTWAGIFPYLETQIPTITNIEDGDKNIVFNVSTGIGIYKLDSLIPQYTQLYIHSALMSSSSSTWDEYHNSTLKQYNVNLYKPPYWATFLSSKPAGFTESNQS